MSELEQAIQKAQADRLARLTGPQTCCVKVGEPDLRNGMKVCGEPVEYLGRRIGSDVGGWRHVDESLTRDHHAVPASYAR